MSLRLSGEAALSDVLTVDQGKTFSLCFECVDASGELITLGTYTISWFISHINFTVITNTPTKV